VVAHSFERQFLESFSRRRPVPFGKTHGVNFDLELAEGLNPEVLAVELDAGHDVVYIEVVSVPRLHHGNDST